MGPSATISVIVPAYNEEGNLPGTLEEIVPILEENFRDYEILLFDDKSADATGAIADRAAAANPRVRAVHNAKNMGLGYNYRTGAAMARMDYVMLVPGDNEIAGDSYRAMFRLLGQADMVVPYTVNTEIRPPGRRFISRWYTWLINALFGRSVPYYNGPVVHKRSLIPSVEITTDGFAYQTEAVLKLLRDGRTYVPVGMVLKERRSGRSKALDPRNVARVLKTIWLLLWRIRLKS